jgi:ribosomal protein S18 acetylase RimI-like enzyme
VKNKICLIFDKKPMQIKSLNTIDFEDIMTCFYISFSDYSITMPNNNSFWKNRFEASRIDFEYSFGAFYNGKLVGFILNGIDFHNGKLTAFNTGTGVIPDYRGRQIIDKIYAFALPLLIQKGVRKYLLEVLQNNTKAISLYKRIGFNIKRNLLSFSGQLEAISKPMHYKKVTYKALPKHLIKDDEFYAWDNMSKAIETNEKYYDIYLVYNVNNLDIGYFIIHKLYHYLHQFEVIESADFLDVFKAIRQVSEAVKIINVDDRETNKIEFLLKYGFANTANQYEMELML